MEIYNLDKPSRIVPSNVPPFEGFDLSKYKSPYNPKRHVSVGVADALVDPNITIRVKNRSPERKDPGYAEINKRSQRQNDI